MEDKRYVEIDVGKATMVVRILFENHDKFKVIQWSGKTDSVGRARLMKPLTANDR